MAKVIHRVCLASDKKWMWISNGDDRIRMDTSSLTIVCHHHIFHALSDSTSP